MSGGRETRTPRGRRLFFALWPNAGLAARLAALNGRLGMIGRATPAERVHLTVLFLGTVSDSTETGVVERLPATMASGPVELVLDTVGCFRRAGVAWVAPGAVPQALTDLHATLWAAAAAEVALEPRGFRPHVTLARLPHRYAKRGRGDGGQHKVWESAGAQAIDPIRWTATELVLVESVATDSGVDYRARHRWPLL